MLEKLRLAQNALARMVERPGGAQAEDYQEARKVLANIREVIAATDDYIALGDSTQEIGPVTHIEGVDNGNT